MLMMLRWKIASMFFACFLGLIFVGPLRGDEKIHVAVSIPPQAYFVQQIAGEHAVVQVLIRPGNDPHTYEPRPSQMKLLSDGAIYFAVGLPFEEALLPRLQSLSSSLRIVKTQKDIERLVGSDHHSGHDHELVDPHIWLSPSLVKIQAAAIRDGFVALDPAHTSEYNRNYSIFCSQIDQLDQLIRGEFQGKTKNKFVVVHPSWAYFAREYDLEQIAMEIEGKEPKAADLAALIQKMKEEGLSTIFVSPQFSKKIAESLAREVGASIVVIDPLPINWAEGMLHTAQVIGESLR
jgi:zinc transport system substrate-binding protein